MGWGAEDGAMRAAYCALRTRFSPDSPHLAGLHISNRATQSGEYDTHGFGRLIVQTQNDHGNRAAS